MIVILMTHLELSMESIVRVNRNDFKLSEIESVIVIPLYIKSYKHDLQNFI